MTNGSWDSDGKCSELDGGSIKFVLNKQHKMPNFFPKKQGNLIGLIKDDIIIIVYVLELSHYIMPNYKVKLKKKIFDILRRNNILVNVHYIPIHLQPYYMKNFGFKKGQFKLAENYYDRAISLPIYYSLSNSRVQSIINLIKKYL